MNPEFEEWLEVFAGNEEFDVEFVAREAYKLGLRRGYDAQMDSKLSAEVAAELLEIEE